jgi:hypothetical protein
MKSYENIPESIKIMLEYHSLNSRCGISPQRELYESITSALKITDNDTNTVSQIYQISESLIYRIKEENT